VLPTSKQRQQPPKLIWRPKQQAIADQHPNDKTSSTNVTTGERKKKRRRRRGRKDKQHKEEPSTIVSLGPPQTFHATADFVVTEPTSNSFTVPNSLTDTSKVTGRLVRNTLRMPSNIKKFGDLHLTEGGERIRDTPNAGGNSVSSEVLSYEVLRAMYGAELLRTEMELEYFPHGGKITDYSIELYSLHIGVSVTRAMKYNGIFDDEDARRLLTKKLYGVNESSRLVCEPFHKQILHVFATHEYIADVLERVYDTLDPELQSTTLVVVTVAHDNADWVFRNPVDPNFVSRRKRRQRKQ